MNLFAGGQRKNQKWPSNLQPVNVPDVTTYPSSTELYVDVALPYWIFTSGISIMADQRYGVALEVDPPSSKDRFCIGSTAERVSTSPLPDTETRTVMYTICSGTNITFIHQQSLQMYRTNKLDNNFDYTLIEKPQWSTMSYAIDEEHNLDQEAVIALADMITFQELPVSHIVIDPRWEDQYLGDGFNAEFFPEPTKLLSDLKVRNITAIFTFHPFMSFANREYQELTKDPATRRYFAKRDGRLGSPLSANWWMGRAAMLDFTEPDAVRWKGGKVQTFLRDYGLTSCRFLGGTSGWIPETMDGKASAYWRDFHLKYAEGARKICGGKVQVETSGSLDGRVVRMKDARAKEGESMGKTLDDCLKALIPSALTVSVLGHPVFIAPAVGGNPYINQSGLLDLGTAGM